MSRSSLFAGLLSFSVLSASVGLAQAPALPDDADTEEKISLDLDAPVWRSDDKSEDKKARTCIMPLGEGGTFKGKLVRLDREKGESKPVENLRVYILTNGRLIDDVERRTDREGNFEFKGLKPGIYSFVGAGREGLIATGVGLFDAGGVEVPRSVLQVESAIIPPSNAPVAKQLIRAFVPAVGQGGGAVNAATATEKQTAEDTDMHGPVTTPKDQQEKDYQSADLPTSLSIHEVRLVGGSVRGRFRRLIKDDSGFKNFATVFPKDLKVFFLRDNKVVTQVKIRDRGIFEAKNLTPGVYSVLAAGPSGFSGFSVNVVEGSETVQRDPNNPFRFVTRSVSAVLDLGGVLVPPNSIVGGYPDTPDNPAGDGNQTPPGGDVIIPPINPPTNNTMGPTGASGTGGGNPVNFSAPNGGGGTGGFPGGGGGGTGNSGEDVPEIDPSAAATGLVLLLGMVLLMIDLFRPR